MTVRKTWVHTLKPVNNRFAKSRVTPLRSMTCCNFGRLIRKVVFRVSLPPKILYTEALVLLERREVMEKVAPKGMHLVTKNFFDLFLI